MAAAMLFSCRGNIDPEGDKPQPDEPEGPAIPENAELRISSDKNLIQTFDDYATITVTVGDVVLTEDVTFYVGTKPVTVTDSKFTTTEPGKHELWASYGTRTSNKVTITAIDVKIPETPADPQPSGTSFKTKVLIAQFTTTGCSPCARMKDFLHNVMADAELSDKLILTACHSGLINGVADPSYIKTNFDEFAKLTGFPYLFMDMYYGFNNYTTPVGEFKKQINKMYDFKKDSAAGLAVNSSIVDGKLVAKVTVKAAVEGEYRVGAFLLEDGIYGQQSSATADWMNIHDSVIRYIDSQYYTNAGKEMYYGHSVGNVEKGKTSDYVFVWNLDEIWKKGALAGEQSGGYYWDPFVQDKLHLAVFVSAVGKDEKGNEFWYVNNAIDCTANGQTKFEYR